MSWLGFSDFVAYSARGGDEAQAPKPNATELGTYYQSISDFDRAMDQFLINLLNDPHQNTIFGR